MRILIGNDDGIDAAGLRALARVCAQRHEVYIAAPWTEQSGMAHALQVQKPMEVEELPELAAELGAARAIRVAGTPTDSVKLFLESLIEEGRPIDLVLSGINHGANLATDVLYSGTVGAAMEGRLHEIPSAAISLNRHAAYPYERVAELALAFLEEHMTAGAPFFYNINFPRELKSETFTPARLGRRDYDNAFRREEKGGRVFYVVQGEIRDSDDGPGTDLFVTEQGGISVTPLITDLTDRAALRNS